MSKVNILMCMYILLILKACVLIVKSSMGSISSVYVTNRSKINHDKLKSDSLRTMVILKTFESNKVTNENVDSKSSAIPESIRRNECLNEFTSNETIISSSFFNVFLLGKAYMSKSSLNKQQKRHLFLQYTGHAARNHDLIFFLFDQAQRHGNINGINAAVRSHKKSFQKFTELVKDKDFQKKLRKAKRNPEGKTAKMVMDIVTPILTIGGNKTALGALERNDAISKINAMCFRYGMPTLFLTVAIDDVNCLNS